MTGIFLDYMNWSSFHYYTLRSNSGGAEYSRVVACMYIDAA